MSSVYSHILCLELVTSVTKQEYGVQLQTTSLIATVCKE